MIFCLACSQPLHGQAPRIDSIDPTLGPIVGGTLVPIPSMLAHWSPAFSIVYVALAVPIATPGVRLIALS